MAPTPGIHIAPITKPFQAIAGKPLHFIYKPTPINVAMSLANKYLKVDQDQKKIDVPPFTSTDWAFSLRSQDNTIMAICMGYQAWTECQVNTIAVNQSVEVPKGTGRRMLTEVERFSRESGDSRMALHTYSWQARPFYEKLGFRLFGTQDGVPPSFARHHLEKVYATPGSTLSPLPSGPVGELRLVLEPVEKHEELDQQVQDWLNGSTQAKNGSGKIPDYVKIKYALEVLEPGTEAHIGAVAYETLWSEAHLSIHAVHPDKKGKGLGTKIMEDFKTIAKEQGCGRIALETMSWQAKPLYERLGFKVFGEQQDIPIKGATRYFMENVF